MLKNLSDGDWSSTRDEEDSPTPIKEEEKEVIEIDLPVIDFKTILQDLFDYYLTTPSTECYNTLIDLKRASASYNQLKENQD